MATLRHIIGFAALTVFALRCLVPTGFMLKEATAPDGTLLGLEVVICTGHASSPASEKAHLPSSSKPAKNSASNDLCPYASQGNLASALPEPERIETTVRYAAVVYTLTAQVFAQTPHPGPLSARGPPSIT